MAVAQFNHDRSKYLAVKKRKKKLFFHGEKSPRAWKLAQEYLLLIVPITCVVFQFHMCLLNMSVAIKSHLHTKTKRRNTSIKVYSASKRVAPRVAPSNVSICRYRTPWPAHFTQTCVVSVSHKSQQHGHDSHGHKTAASSHDWEGHHGGTSAVETGWAFSRRMECVWQ